MATRNAAFTATFLAWDTSANAPKTGDSANITPRILKDGTSAALGTATVTEVDATNFKGLYKVTVAQSEADFAQVVVGGVSATANIEIIPTTYQMERLPDAAPDAAGGLPISDAGALDIDTLLGRIDAAVTTRMATYTQPTGFLAAAFPTTVASTTNVTAATGIVLSGVTHTGAVVPTVSALTGHTAQTGDNYALANGASGFAAIKTDTGALVTRITSALFNGITSLAEWLGLIAGKQAGDATALTELKATGAGSGTFDPTTDSAEALRGRGDASWITATGFSTHGDPDPSGYIDAAISSRNATTPPDSTAIQAAADAAIVANHLDHLLKTDYDPAAKPGTATALLNELVEDNSGVSRYTAGALAQAPSGTANDAYEIKGSYMLLSTTLNYVYWLEENGQRVGTISAPSIDIFDKDAVTTSFTSTPTIVGTNMAKGSGTFSPTDNLPYTVVAKATYGGTEYTGVLPAGATAA